MDNEQLAILPGELFTKNELKTRLKTIGIPVNLDCQDKGYFIKKYNDGIVNDDNKMKILKMLKTDNEDLKKKGGKMHLYTTWTPPKEALPLMGDMLDSINNNFYIQQNKQLEFQQKPIVSQDYKGVEHGQQRTFNNYRQDITKIQEYQDNETVANDLKERQINTKFTNIPISLAQKQIWKTVNYQDNAKIVENKPPLMSHRIEEETYQEQKPQFNNHTNIGINELASRQNFPIKKTEQLGKLGNQDLYPRQSIEQNIPFKQHNECYLTYPINQQKEEVQQNEPLNIQQKRNLYYQNQAIQNLQDDQILINQHQPLFQQPIKEQVPIQQQSFQQPTIQQQANIQQQPIQQQVGQQTNTQAIYQDPIQQQPYHQQPIPQNLIYIHPSYPPNQQQPSQQPSQQPPQQQSLQHPTSSINKSQSFIEPPHINNTNLNYMRQVSLSTPMVSDFEMNNFHPSIPFANKQDIRSSASSNEKETNNSWTSRDLLSQILFGTSLLVLFYYIWKFTKEITSSGSSIPQITITDTFKLIYKIKWPLLLVVGIYFIYKKTTNRQIAQEILKDIKERLKQAYNNDDSEEQGLGEKQIITEYSIKYKLSQHDFQRTILPLLNSLRVKEINIKQIEERRNGIRELFWIWFE